MLSSLPFTLPALQHAYANGVSPAEVIDEVLARLEHVDDPNIFIHLRDRDSLRAEAQALGAYDPDRPLWGIPFAAKDNIDVAGIETTAGCPAYAYTPDNDAFVVAKLRAAGALMIGKTNLDQFATGLVGVRTPYGAPRNAIDPEIVPGGSSGGSGVVVGHGTVTFALGTDTAGSGRVPAALNNIVGLKPTLGALSASGVVPACRTLDTVSIFALTVDDAYAVFGVAQGYDAQDAYSKSYTHKALSRPHATLRIGVPDRASAIFMGDTIQEVTFARDVDQLAKNGSKIEEIDFKPFFAIAEMLYQGAWVAERHTVISDLLDRDPEAVFPVTRQIISLADGMSADDAFRGFYRLAELKRDAQPLLDGLDMLCVPSVPTFATVDALKDDPIGPNNMLGTYTNFVNLMDMCGIAVPTAPRTDGRPGSVTLLAQAGQDANVASVARLFEADCPRNLGATAHPLPSPKALATAPAETIQIAVCGAHMRGLALNSQLTDLGATFGYETQTAPHYHFYALPGGPPDRPGLLRSNAPDATAISVEVWDLPLEQFGQFMSGIPAPLCIGSVELANGRWVKGFLSESAGTSGAQEITHLGDWRTYLAREKELS